MDIVQFISDTAASAQPFAEKQAFLWKLPCLCSLQKQIYRRDLPETFIQKSPLTLGDGETLAQQSPALWDRGHHGQMQWWPIIGCFSFEIGTHFLADTWTPHSHVPGFLVMSRWACYSALGFRGLWF